MALGQRLQSDGAQVTCLSRSARTQAGPMPVRTYASLGRDDHWDVVINLAGAAIADRRWRDRRKQVLFDSRLGPTRALVAWMKACRQPPQVLLSGSAIGWYGAQDHTRLTETSAARDDFTHALCASWEAAALEAVALGVPVVLLRTGVVLHPAGGMLARLRLPFRCGLGGRLGDGRQMISWISREDWVEAVCALARAHLAGQPDAPAGPVNLTAPEAVSNAQFTLALSRTLRRPAVLPLPRGLLALLLGDMSTLLLDGQHVLPERLQRFGYRFRQPALAPALASMLG